MEVMEIDDNHSFPGPSKVVDEYSNKKTCNLPR